MYKDMICKRLCTTTLHRSSSKHVSTQKDSYKYTDVKYYVRHLQMFTSLLSYWSDGDSKCQPTGCTEGVLAVSWALKRARAVLEYAIMRIHKL